MWVGMACPISYLTRSELARGRACNRYLGTSMHVRKYDMMMLVRHAKDGDGQTRHWRYQRRPCAVRGGLIYPR